MASAPDGVSDGAEEEQNGTDGEQDDPDRPENADVQDEPDDEQDYAESDHGGLPFCAVGVPTADGGAG